MTPALGLSQLFGLAVSVLTRILISPSTRWMSVHPARIQFQRRVFLHTLGAVNPTRTRGSMTLYRFSNNWCNFGRAKSYAFTATQDIGRVTFSTDEEPSPLLRNTVRASAIASQSLAKNVDVWQTSLCFIWEADSPPPPSRSSTSTEINFQPAP